MTLDFTALAGEDVRLADLVGTALPPKPPVPTPPRFTSAPDTGGLEFAPQQQEAIAKVVDWFQNPTSQVFRLFGFAGSGKSLRHGSKVQTPNGPVNIEDLKINDLVFGADGLPIRVTGVFPQGVRDGAKVTFRDGVSVYCDWDHLWNVQTVKMRQLDQPFKTMTTREILDAGVRFQCGIYRFSIPLCEEVEYLARDLPIDPYVLGALIGDGTDLGRTPTLCISRDDRFIAEEVQRRLSSWVDVRVGREGETCERFRLTDPRHRHNELAAAFRELGLAVKSPQRFIPREYLLGSPAQRWALLRGLMDTDGSARDNRVSFSTKSAQLAADLTTLVQSLGGIAIAHKTSRDGEHAINVKLLHCPFLLPRKAAQWWPSAKNPPSRRIVAIEPAGPAEHTCISVAATDGLYLTDHYVVTHNTTLARHIVDQLGVRALFAAFTGKAAYVLRQKRCEGASTVHSLIYQPVEKVRARLEELKAQLADTVDLRERVELQRQIAHEQAKVDNPDWILREESELDTAQLLVLDEVSMVGERMARDLLSYDRPILCLGDPAQLPPVDGGGWFINAPADHLLTEIHRSALDSPVTRLATAIRNSQPGDRSYGVFGRDGTSGRREQLSIAELLDFDQVLVGKNATRWQAVHLLRALRGLLGQRPAAGDRIIALANSSEAEVFNGQQFDVLDSRDHDREDRYWVRVRDDEGHERSLVVWAAGFRDLEGERQAKRDGRGTVVAATFGQAITAHKSQGSQYPKVLVIDESSVFYNAAYREAAKTRDHSAAAEAGHLNGCRWLYTATTRASERVVIVPRLNGLVTA